MLAAIWPFLMRVRICSGLTWRYSAASPGVSKRPFFPVIFSLFLVIRYPHFVNAQLSQTSHPASLLRGYRQSGHLLTGEVFTGSQSPFRVSSIARAIASGQESTSISFFSLRRAIVERQRMFLSCSMRTRGSTSHRRAAETARQVASLCDGQPPALPRLANTSHRPFSSSLTLMKSVPQPVRDLMVWPDVLRGLGRGEIKLVFGRAVLWALLITWFSLELSRYTVMPLQPSSKARRYTLSTFSADASDRKLTV